jgi:16S rRNA (guanine1207-N2)-methyltransferase
VDAFLGGRLEVQSARGVVGPDRLLIACLDEAIAGRVLVCGGREGVAAIAAARLFPEAAVEHFHLDAYESLRARQALARNGAGSVACRIGADLPGGGTYDWVLLPLSRIGELVLASELIQEARDSLREGGKLLCAVDNPRDRWVHERVLETFGAATIRLREKQGMAYIARKRRGEEPRRRDFRRRFSATVFGKELEIETRPGVFSHGEFDEGALALSEMAPIGEGARVVDLGCGSGILGIGAALAAPGGRVLLADSNARSARAARENAVRNGAAGNMLVLLACDLGAVRDASFDVVLANPPYYADHRITELFVREGHRVLARGGVLHLVTRSAERPAEIIRASFGGLRSARRRGYHVLSAERRDGGAG